jgi:hypothetical protein
MVTTTTSVLFVLLLQRTGESRGDVLAREIVSWVRAVLTGIQHQPIYMYWFALYWAQLVVNSATSSN